jgi:hypothetical protein
MKAEQVIRETPTATEDVRRIAALTAALRVICIANQMQTQHHYMTIVRTPRSDEEIDFTGPVPFGFAFTEGHEASFCVPFGHRFVIEQINVSCWPPIEDADVQMVTKSPHMFRVLTVTDRPEHTSCDERTKGPSAVPIQVCGSSASTFLFSSGKLQRSSRVPPGNYVQVWGYLEPTNDGVSC